MLIRTLSLVVLLLAANLQVLAYYHCYTPRCQQVRLEDKVKRLEKKLSRSKDELEKSKIQIEIDATLSEIERYKSLRKQGD